MATKKTPPPAQKTMLSSSHRSPHPSKPSAKKPASRPAKLEREAQATRAPRVVAPPKARPTESTPPSARSSRHLPGREESKAVAAARRLALDAATAGLEKKALDVNIVDVQGRVDYADYLVLMSGTSDRHVAALVQGIEAELKQKGERPQSVEGMAHAQWVLMDYGDVVVHVFQGEARALYDMDGLWMDATRLPVPSGKQGATSPSPP